MRKLLTPLLLALAFASSALAQNVGTSISNWPAALPPSGAASGDLGGTYPAPTVTNLSHVTNASLPNSGLVNASTAVNSQTCALGASCTVTVSISAGVTGLGTGVATALGTNIGSAGAPVVNGGALGTPSSGVATNLTGTAASLTAGSVTTNANLTGPITSVGNATSIASQTGTGSVFVVQTAPTFLTSATSPLFIANSIGSVAAPVFNNGTSGMSFGATNGTLKLSSNGTLGLTINTNGTTTMADDTIADVGSFQTANYFSGHGAGNTGSLTLAAATGSGTAAFLNLAKTAGIGLDFSVDGIIKAKTRAMADTGVIGASAHLVSGTAPTPSGSCSVNTQTGGNTAGTFKANGACAGGTVILTFATTAPTGWACTAHNRTTPTNLMNQTASATTTGTFTGTMTSLDIVSFNCTQY